MTIAQHQVGVFVGRQWQRVSAIIVFVFPSLQEQKQNQEKSIYKTVQAFVIMLLCFQAHYKYILKGSVCPSPTPSTSGQPCSQLPGALECNYEYEHCCCDRCAHNFTASCVYGNSDNGVWQSSLCHANAEGCGSEGECFRADKNKNKIRNKLMNANIFTTVKLVIIVMLHLLYLPTRRITE